MKTSNSIQGLLILLILTVSATYAQQQFTHTVTARNKACNSTCTILDIPGLNDNPGAIIIVKPVTKGGTPNPHPVGVYYTDPKKWSIINLDGVAIPEGAIFNVQYYPNPSADQFVYVIPKQGVNTCIDHPGLDSFPNAQIRYSATQSPRGAYFNKEEIKIGYDASAHKWCVVNVNQQPVRPETAYNIVIDSSGARTSDLTKIPDTAPIGTVKTATDPKPLDPSSLLPNGNAGGDLSGTYPNPTVNKLNGKPISKTAPQIGQMLRWNGTEWEPVTINPGGTNYTPGMGLSLDGTTLNTLNKEPIWNASHLVGRDISTDTPTVGQVLKWGGGAWYPADDNVSTSVAPTSSTTPAMQAFYKERPDGMPTDNISDFKPETKITVLSHTIVLTKKSRLVISAAVNLRGSSCPLGCLDGEGSFFVRVNNTGNQMQNTDFFIPRDKSITVQINSYIRDFEAGTQTIEFVIKHRQGTSAFDSLAMNSSVLVIPL